ncbi:unnamed protein product [Callosobruchus maculatus]|uniref:Uncharacterized protein n=1 Tax=Callosobruchus maculatus TaxID=64391 RepID=A0A653D0I1_CALMS|nr:unnamed protein product [Callosobruchus maculatus]
MGCEGLCAERGAVRADLQAGEQTARQVRRVRGLRRRVQIRPAGQQLYLPWRLHLGHPSSAHLQGTRRPAVPRRMASTIRKVLRKRNLPHSFRRQQIFR